MSEHAPTPDPLEPVCANCGRRIAWFPDADCETPAVHTNEKGLEYVIDYQAGLQQAGAVVAPAPTKRRRRGGGRKTSADFAADPFGVTGVELYLPNPLLAWLYEVAAREGKSNSDFVAGVLQRAEISERIL